FFRTSTELCSNVSRSGLFVRTAEPLQPGRRLLVELDLPSGDSVEAVGRVAWVKKRVSPETERGVGIELVGGIPEQLESLQAFVSKRDRRRGPGGPASIG
ncbi:MAG: hypothetical protein HKP30_12525, partial [Myxococcales bacterium]|nr:hypothetical protein [Myxococcales bacterium]